MKIVKLHSIIALGLFALLAACGNDKNDNSVDLQTLKVVSAKTSFDALGGKDTILVNNDVKKAYALAPWAKVNSNGKLVVVTVDVNQDMQSRHTAVVIKATDNDSTIVAIDQLGPVTQIDLPENIVFNDSANAVSYKAKSTFGIKISSLNNWITANYANGEVSISTTENNEGHLRTGQIVVESSMGKDTINVTQIDLDRDILGDYYLQLVETDDERKPVTRNYAVKLVKESNKLMLKFTTNDLAFPVTYSAEKGGLSVAGGQYAGMFDNNHIGTIVGPSDGQTSTSTTVTISGKFVYNPERASKAAFLEGTELSFGKEPAFVLGKFSSTVIEYKNYKGYLIYGNDAQLFKRKL